MLGMARAAALGAGVFLYAGQAAAQTETQFTALHAVSEAMVAEEFCPTFTFDQGLGDRVLKAAAVDLSRDHFKALIRSRIAALRNRWDMTTDRTAACAETGSRSLFLVQREKPREQDVSELSLSARRK